MCRLVGSALMFVFGFCLLPCDNGNGNKQVLHDASECLGKTEHPSLTVAANNMCDSRPLLAEQLSRLLRARGYTAHATAGGSVSSWPATAPATRDPYFGSKHTFVTVWPSSATASADEEPVIVEAQLKQIFLAGRSTRAYDLICAELPEVFVCSSPSRMRSLVTFLCERLAEALVESGLDVPPWRRTSNILSFWNLRSLQPLSDPYINPHEQQRIQRHERANSFRQPQPQRAAR